DADPSQSPLRHTGPAGDVGPGVSAVGCTPEAAPRPTAVQTPWKPPRLPEARVQDARVPWGHGKVDSACVRASMGDKLPARATILRAVDAALVIGAVGMAEGRDIDEIGVGGMDTDAADVAGGLKTAVGPAGAGRRWAGDAGPRRD